MTPDNPHISPEFFAAVEARMRDGSTKDGRAPGDWRMVVVWDEFERLAAMAHHCAKAANHASNADALCFSSDPVNIDFPSIEDHLLGTACRAMIAWSLARKLSQK